jgi:hypothetical protein
MENKKIIEFVKQEMGYQATGVVNCLNCRFAEAVADSNTRLVCVRNPAIQFFTTEDGACKLWEAEKT